MTKLNELPKIKTRRKKRPGRGYGSGKGGHTSGRGTKGQKARGKMGLIFEGTKLKKSFVRRLPLARGKGKFKSLTAKPLVVNLQFLNLLPKGSVVTRELLVKHGLISAKEIKEKIKILGGGELKVPLVVELPCSRSAEEKIKKAGGKVAFSNKKPKNR